jgi:hypothetical protein
VQVREDDSPTDRRTALYSDSPSARFRRGQAQAFVPRPVQGLPRPEPSLEVTGSGGDKSFDKIKQNFKCPKFSGQSKDWKTWNTGFMRYLSIWGSRTCSGS